MDYSEITATITDKWGNVEKAYAGSVQTWSLINGQPDKQWRTMMRKLLLSDRTTEPAGWRVTFTAAEMADA